MRGVVLGPPTGGQSTAGVLTLGHAGLAAGVGCAMLLYVGSKTCSAFQDLYGSSKPYEEISTVTSATTFNGYDARSSIKQAASRRPGRRHRSRRDRRRGSAWDEEEDVLSEVEMPKHDGRRSQRF